MASLATHFTAFLLLFPTGLRRLFSSSSLYLSNPSLFRSKPWYFFSSAPKSPGFDLYLLLIALPISSFSELFLFLTFSGPSSYRFAFSQQSLTLLFFWLLLLFILLREHTDSLSVISEGLVFVLVGITFLIEFSFTGSGISGLGITGAVYGLLGRLTLLCALCCLYLALKPTAFWAEFVLSCGLVFKGTWALQAGLSLGTDAFVPKGCQKLSAVTGQETADLKCGLQEDSLRGVALMNLLFVGHAILVLVMGVVLFGVSSLSSRGSRFGDAHGPLLAQLESENAPIRPIHELELE
ncbi:uncharacterized protein LOC116209619 [Punica granatum]|uniref:Uncharacterized protein n=2 Tax=Punica granatum TaxID=22663 RepID=A0A218WDC6_PUNGR|nr:uncharacterized protein LOC116209619 [Punica granatum]OWM70513.1 hypothetical protein CDL15_Pgr011989 [Punica granatum]PKI78577.1 hypothetical protein CRG98_000954 [Punica granatum]